MKVNIGSTEYIMSQLNGDDDVFRPRAGEYDEYDEPIVGGYTHPILGVININKDIPLQIKEQTFWHEAVHAMLYEIGMNELSQDEGFVDAFSKQIYMVFKSNKIDKIYSFLGDNNEK